MTIRRGGRPRDDVMSQAHRPGDESHDTSDRPPYPLAAERRFDPRDTRASRARERRLGSVGGGGGRGGFGGILRFLLFAVVLGAIVIGAGLTVLRPLVASAVVGWAADNPTALGLPFVADLVREDLGSALTDPPSGDASQVEFVVAQGDTAVTIADRLASQGFLRNPRAFVFLAITQHLDNKLEAGTYVLKRNMTPQELVSGLLEATARTITITFREGLRIEQMAAKLETLPVKLDVQQFVDLATHPPATLLADYPWLDLPQGASLEGYLFPATYDVAPDITAEQLIRKLLDAFQQQVGDARMNVPKARGLTFNQVLTLASIVDHEAVLDSERPIIAGVYQNRLNNKTFLDADPTLLYAHDSMQLKQTPLQQWTQYVFWAPWAVKFSDVTLPKDLQGYQTYQQKGLPPGPIATPSLASIDAALQPDTSTGYLYFLAVPNGGGKHVFAKTYQQQLSNMAKYGYG